MYCDVSFTPWFLVGYFGNAFKKPVVFDPVGVGASAFRKETVKGWSPPSTELYVYFIPFSDLLNTWQASVIKGNAAELAALASSPEASIACIGHLVNNDISQVKSKGVDSVGSGFSNPSTFVRNLARKESAFNFRSTLGFRRLSN